MNPKVVFYDVSPEAWDEEIFKLAAAAWSRGQARLLIVVDGPKRAEDLDAFLWTHREEVFLPHEIAADTGDLMDPSARVLISSSHGHRHGATLLLADRPVPLDFAADFEVVMDVVDHRSDEALEASRARFKAWRQRGVQPEHRRAKPSS